MLSTPFATVSGLEHSGVTVYDAPIGLLDLTSKPYMGTMKKGKRMSEEKVQSRRSFLKLANTAIGIGAVASLAGCAKEQGESEPAPAEKDEMKWDLEYDAVVVGAGAAGNAASLTLALEGNGAKVLLLEKGDHPLGNSPFSAGRCLWTDDKAGFLTYMHALFGEEGTVGEDVLEAYTEGVYTNKDWILSLGPNQDEMSIETAPAPSQDWGYPEYPELPGSNHCHCLRVGVAVGGKEPTGPKGIPNFLAAKVAEHTDVIDYKTNSPAKALVQDPETKRILGVIAEIEGKQVAIKANKGVIMTTGGFENNPEMLENFLRQHNAVATCSGNTGDGHKMCMAVGADLWHMNSCFGMHPKLKSLDGSTPGVSFTAKYGITIGTNAKRFFQDWGTGGPESTGTYAYDDDLRLSYGMRHGHVNWGGEWMSLPLPSDMWFLCDSEGLAAGAFGKSTEPDKDDLAYKGDTLEEIASQADLDLPTLEKTVKLWNDSVDAGEDFILGRPAKFMEHAKIATPPFYIGRIQPSIANTDGGPRRSAKGEILDTTGKPIPGLYSAGEFGSIWVHMYQAAGNIAECCIFGRISARSLIADN